VNQYVTVPTSAPGTVVFESEALENIRALGAGLVDVPFPELDELLQNTSVINAEFKFDLLDFFAKYPSAPMHTLGEILSSGKSRACVGSRPVAAGFLKELQPHLGDIHGQHDQARLFSPTEERARQGGSAGQ